MIVIKLELESSSSLRRLSGFSDDPILNYDVISITFRQLTDEGNSSVKIRGERITLSIITEISDE